MSDELEIDLDEFLVQAKALQDERNEKEQNLDLVLNAKKSLEQTLKLTTDERNKAREELEQLRAEIELMKAEEEGREEEGLTEEDLAVKIEELQK